jgi:hypothetical protein
MLATPPLSRLDYCLLYLDPVISQPRARIGYPLTVYSHTPETLQYTLDRRTTIQMPMLGKETDHVAFFILDHDTPAEVRTLSTYGIWRY